MGLTQTPASIKPIQEKDQEQGLDFGDLIPKQQEQVQATPATPSGGFDFGNLLPSQSTAPSIGQNLTGAEEVAGVPKIVEQFGQVGASLGAGVFEATSGLFRTLDSFTGLIEEKTGLPKGGLFEDIADDAQKWAQFFESRGIRGEGGLEKFSKPLYEGIGAAAVDLPVMMGTGLPAFSAATAGGAAIEAGGGGSEIAKSTASGFAHGLLLHGILKAGNFLPRGARLPLMGSVFSGESLKAEMQKPEEERDYAKVVADFTIGAGLTFPGKGLTVAELKNTPKVIEAAKQLKVKIEQDRVLEAMDVAERVKSIRGDELGISGYGDGQGRIGVDLNTTIRPFEKLRAEERKVVREADIEALPPTIGTEAVRLPEHIKREGNRETEVEGVFKPQFTDALTKSTFAQLEGETLEQAVKRHEAPFIKSGKIVDPELKLKFFVRTAKVGSFEPSQQADIFVETLKNSDPVKIQQGFEQGKIRRVSQEFDGTDFSSRDPESSTRVAFNNLNKETQDKFVQIAERNINIPEGTSFETSKPEKALIDANLEGFFFAMDVVRMKKNPLEFFTETAGIELFEAVKPAAVGGKKLSKEPTKPKLKQDINVKFIDETVVADNKPVEQYEMEIGGVKTDFFVSRARGENLRRGIEQQLEVYTDPLLPGEVRNAAASALAGKNFGLQKKLNEQYHEMVRGEVVEKVKKEFKNSKVIDEDGNPVIVFHGSVKGFKEFDPAAQNADALFGPGFYFTESAKIAEGYSQASGILTGGGRDPIAVVEQLKADIVRSKERLKTAKEDQVKNFYERQIEADTAEIKRVKEFGTETPNIRPAFLKLNKPFDIDKVYTEKELEKLQSLMDGVLRTNDFENLSKAMKESFDIVGNLSKATRGEDVYLKLLGAFEGAQDGRIAGFFKAEFVQMVRNMNNAKPLVRQFLEEAGFDGITHIGGARTGNDPHQVYIAFNSKQISSAFEPFAKHKAKVLKNNPPPPALPDVELTHQQFIETLPRRFGGKWPDDKPIVDVFAERATQTPTISQELVKAKEQMLNQILPDIKTWNQFMEGYLPLKGLVKKDVQTSTGIKQNIRFRLAGRKDLINRQKKLDSMKVWVADTALMFSQHLGPAGGRITQLMIDGHVRKLEMTRTAQNFRKQITKAYDEADLNGPALERMDVTVSRALEDRTNAESFFTKNGELDERGFDLYKLYRDHFDAMEKFIIASGKETIPDYFTRVGERSTALENMLNGFKDDKFIGLQDNLLGKVQSSFLKDRTGILANYSRDMLPVFDMYNSSVINTLAFEDAIAYFAKPIEKSVGSGGKKITTTNFLEDVPVELRDSRNFGKMKKEVNRWIRDNLEPEVMTGGLSGLVMKARNQLYRTFLSANVGGALDNSTQKMFTQAMTPRETWSIAGDIYKQRKLFTNLSKVNAEGVEIELFGNFPNLQKMMNTAGKDKTVMLEVAESELGGFGTRKTGVRRAFSKVSEYDPFFYIERTNWTHAEVAGVVEYLFKKPEWTEVLKSNNGNALETVEQMLSGNELYQRQALVNARQLSWQTQLMAGRVSSPKLFRTELGRFVGMFKRFPFGQIENIVRSFNQSGTDGIAALRILTRAFPDEVQHVETLRGAETLRKAIESVERTARKFPDDTNVNLAAVSKVRKNVVEMEKDLNDIVKRIQPMNKNNKSSQAKLWSRYVLKRWMYSVMWNVFANVVGDVTFGNDNDSEELTPFERAVRSANRNVIPFYYDVRNPQRLIAPPILPDTGGPFSSPREYHKGMVEWGMNLVPHAGVVNRLSGRMISDAITELTFPKKAKKGKL